jgi:hypothetical protein
MARDIVRHIIDLDLYDVKLLSTPWGACPMTALDPTTDAELIRRIVPHLTEQPDLFIQITVPNEFQPIGKYNIGITAGIETTLISAPWIEGCNRMNTVWAISQHSAEVIKNTVSREQTPDGRIVRELKVTVPVEVLHNCVHTDVFRRIDPEEIPKTITSAMADVKEKFAFLFVGHWMRGNMGEDRKNVGLLVKIFCEAFKNTPSASRPALLLKTSSATFSILDREECLNKIKQIRESVGPNCPNVYLIHGELTDAEMNGLYNHPKVKAHVSFTKGEGFGRPLLEASLSQKPIIASGWSGQLDFLNPEDALLVGGELRPVEPGAVWDNVIIPQSSWFNIDPNQAGSALLVIFKNADRFALGAKRLAKKNKDAFNYNVIRDRTNELLTKYVPKFAPAPQQLQIKLPTLKKVL